MNTTERASHPSRAQIEYLLNFLEQNPTLAKGFSKQPSARDAARKLWESVTIKLNSLGGCMKTSKQWTKYLADKKSAVKKKAAQRYRARNTTGGGVSSIIELSVIEERILTLNPFEETDESPSLLRDHSQLLSVMDMGEERIDQQTVAPCETVNPPGPVTSIDCDPGISYPCVVQINPPGPVSHVECVPGTSYPGVNQSAVQINPPGPVSHVECVPGTSYPGVNQSAVQINPPGPVTLVECVPGTSYPGVNQSAVQIIGDRPETLRTPPRTPNTAATPSPSGSFPSGRRQTAHARNAESRRRRPNRRRLLSPPSQRQSRLSSITERFLQVEEARVQIERRQCDLMENVVSLVRERDAAVAQALGAIGDSLKLLAEALRK